MPEEPAFKMSDVIPSKRTDVIPDRTLSRFTLEAFAMVEDELARRHISSAMSGSMGFPEADRDRMYSAAMAHIAAGAFAYGHPGFIAHSQSKGMRAFILWACLQIAHPEIKLSEARSFITFETEDKIVEAVLELMEFHTPSVLKKVEAALGARAANSTGKSSSDSSDSVENSVGEISAA